MKKRYFGFVCRAVAAISLSWTSLHADVDSSKVRELSNAIGDVILERMESENLPGVAVVVVKDGQTLYENSFGFSDLDGKRRVSLEDDVFRIGSVSKAMTALALARLADRGEIDLDDPVSRYFPELDDTPDYSDSAEPIRLWHLVTHTGGFDQVGIGRHIWQLDKSLDQRKALRPELEEFLLSNNLRRRSPAGQSFRYDTYGMTLAGVVLERIMEMPYPKAMEQALFRPLGMNKTFVEIPNDQAKHLVNGYGFVDGQYQVEPYEVYLTTPASSIDATAADMGRLLRSLTAPPGRSDISLFGKADAFDPMYRPHPEFPGATLGMFESLYDEQNRPLRKLWHGGSMLGFLTNFSIVPEHGLGYFIVTNRDPEAGGGPVSIHARVERAILSVLIDGGEARSFSVPEPTDDMNLDEYAGNYVWGVYCKSCSDEEYEQGGWSMGTPIPVNSHDGMLVIDSQRFVGDRERDVFVGVDGKTRVFFRRDQKGRVATFSYSSSPDAFERVP